MKPCAVALSAASAGGTCSPKSLGPPFYSKFPKDFQVIFGSSITATVLVVFVLNLVFNHWTSGTERTGAVQTAVSEGAVAVDVPHGGVPSRLHENVPE